MTYIVACFLLLLGQGTHLMQGPPVAGMGVLLHNCGVPVAAAADAAIAAAAAAAVWSQHLLQQPKHSPFARRPALLWHLCWC